MKILTSFVFFITFLGISTPILAQLTPPPALCNRVYVWDFTDQSGKKVKLSQNGKEIDITASIADDVERAIAQCKTCPPPIERRGYAAISAQTTNEDRIQAVNELPKEAKKKLNTQGARIVVFGILEFNDASDNVQLHLKFEELKTQSILNSTTIVLTRKEVYYDPESRRNKIACVVAHDIIKSPKPTFNDRPLYTSGAATAVGIGLTVLCIKNVFTIKNNWQAYLDENNLRDPNKAYQTMNRKYKTNTWLAVGSAVTTGIVANWLKNQWMAKKKFKQANHCRLSNTSSKKLIFEGLTSTAENGQNNIGLIWRF